MDDSPTMPEITLPLPIFLKILWGYKKADLRERAVPGIEIVNAIKSVPNYEHYVYIQEQEGCETTVWQPQEWRLSGLPQEQTKEKMRQHSDDADKVFNALRNTPIGGLLAHEILRTIAHQIVHQKSYDGLEALGIKREDIGI